MGVIKENKGQINFEYFNTGGSENWLSVSLVMSLCEGKTAFGSVDFNSIKINVEI